MIKVPVRQIHYHKTVWTHEVMDAMRKSDCLCLNCENLSREDSTTGAKFPCRVANQLTLICQQQDTALAMTRCPKWSPKIC